jgi:hypothetical protein
MKKVRLDKMLLRRITLHVKEQNWFAIAIDFLIVILGVFIGIQVANWNEERGNFQKETALLIELRAETLASIETTKQKIQAYGQVTEAGKRSLKFISAQAPCGSKCWLVLVDFMHASQWQSVDVAHSTFDSMRGIGLPKERKIVEHIEGYLRQNNAAADTYAKLPYFRDLIRQLVPIEAQEYYWKTCWSVKNGAENYHLNCPKGVADELSAKVVDKIVNHPEIEPHLTQWTSHIVNLPNAFVTQISSAQMGVAAIDAELERR